MYMKQKDVVINGKTIPFAFNVRTWLIYYETFGTSPESDLDAINYKTNEGILHATIVVFPQIMWALAKTANPRLPKFKKWYKSLGAFNSLNTFEQLLELFPGEGVAVNG